MPKTVTYYECPVCCTQYTSPARAARCEAYILPPCPVKKDDLVKVYERYDDPEEDRVVRVRIGPGLLARVVPCDDPAEEERRAGVLPDAEWHQWLVKVKNSHRMSKDPDGYSDEVSLDNLQVDGKWLK